MACCCKACKSSNTATSCLGRCDLPKHKCLYKDDVKPGPIPKCMGWLYNAKDSPEHQLRCGWRPGHISCPVLKRIEAHNSCHRECSTCPYRCSRPSCGGPCPRPSCIKPSCIPSCAPIPCLPSPSCPRPSNPCQPVIRIVRHAGNYAIYTKPDSVSNAPSGPYPLKYVLNVDDEEPNPKASPKYSVEAKFNDYHFDYTSSQASFVLDFSPPEPKCSRPCPKKSTPCFPEC